MPTFFSLSTERTNERRRRREKMDVQDQEQSGNKEKIEAKEGSKHYITPRSLSLFSHCVIIRLLLFFSPFLCVFLIDPRSSWGEGGWMDGWREWEEDSSLIQSNTSMQVRRTLQPALWEHQSDQKSEKEGKKEREPKENGTHNNLNQPSISQFSCAVRLIERGGGVGGGQQIPRVCRVFCCDRRERTDSHCSCRFACERARWRGRDGRALYLLTEVPGEGSLSCKLQGRISYRIARVVRRIIHPPPLPLDCYLSN